MKVAVGRLRTLLAASRRGDADTELRWALPDAARRMLHIFLAGGLFAAFLAAMQGGQVLHEGHLPIHLFIVQDLPWFILAALVAAALMSRAISARLQAGADAAVGQVFRSAGWSVAVLAGFVFAVAAIGTFVVYHQYPLAMDEFMADFQTKILQRGAILAPVDEAWRGLITALQPNFTYQSADGSVWGALYLPVASAFRALLSPVGLESVTSAVLTAASVVLAAAVAGQLWPGRGDVRVIAAAGVALSAQALITAMTPYAMPGHLFLNLAWLYLFFRDDRLGHAFAPWIGIAAVGLHQMHAHALFVMPFMLSLLFERRWRLAAYYAVLYGVGHFAWLHWYDIAELITHGPQAATQAVGEGGLFLDRLQEIVQMPGAGAIIMMAVNLLRFLAWQDVAICILVALAIGNWRQCPSRVRLLAWSIAFSVIPYLLIMPSQGHGWGYRYLHGLIGNFGLIAACGWTLAVASLPDRARALQPATLVAVSFAITLAVALPLRAWQAERFVGPYATASEHIAAIDADIVVIDHAGTLFGVDLVRNEPFLNNRPLVLSLWDLEPEQLGPLCRDHSVAVVNRDDLAALGLSDSRKRVATNDEQAALSDALARCAVAQSSAIPIVPVQAP